jgi:hypothetical protein
MAAAACHWVLMLPREVRGFYHAGVKKLVGRLMKYFAIGGATAIVLLFYFGDGSTVR